MTAPTTQALEPELPEPPTLPKELLNLIGEYGMARTDGVFDLEIQHRWLTLIEGIKSYALAYAISAIAADRNKREGAVAYCVDCNKVGMSNCAHFDECGGEQRCVTCHQRLPSAAPVSAGLSDEDVEREAKLLWNIFAASHHTEWDNEPNKAEYRNAARSILARALEARMRVPGGWVSVPREPTEAMKQAGYHAPYKPGLPDPYHAITIYKAMIAAAPTTNSDLERHKKEPGQQEEE